jgi:nonsense-mediated mRNA decay protein 3
MFCIKCGAHAIRDNFCEKHFLEKNELFRIKDVRIKLCDCGFFYYKQWQTGDFVKTIVSNEIKTYHKITKISMKSRRVGNKVYVTVTCTGKIKNIPKTEEKKILIICRRHQCDTCSKLSGGYYEAVIQIRGERSEEILEQLKKSPDVSSIQKLKNGYDVRFIYKSTANSIAKIMKEKEYDVIFSYRHVTTKKGKMIYRNFYSVR